MRGREEISSKRTSMTIDAGNWGMLGIKMVLASLVGQMVKNLPAMQKTPWRREWQPTLIFLPENSMDRGAWWATVHEGHKESDMTEQLKLSISCCM